MRELAEIFRGSNREVTLQDMQKMEYLGNVIKETLRLYTVGTVIGRRLMHDVTLPSKVQKLYT